MLALKNLLVIFADFEQVKNSFTGHNATALVTLLFGTQNDMDLRERFLLSDIFLPYTPSCCFQVFPQSRHSTLKLAGLHADL